MPDSKNSVSFDIMSNFLANEVGNTTSFVQREGGVVYNKEQSNYPLSKKGKE
jgi:hypothetical protein